MTCFGRFVRKFLYTTLLVGCSAQTPPKLAPVSKTLGLWPACRRKRAAATPALPPPTTATRRETRRPSARAAAIMSSDLCMQHWLC